MNNANEQVVNAQGAETKQVESPETIISGTIMSCTRHIGQDKDGNSIESIVITTSNGYDMINMYRKTFENLLCRIGATTFRNFNTMRTDINDDRFLTYLIGCPITYFEKEYVNAKGETVTKFVAKDIVFDEEKVLDKVIKYKDLLKL